MKRTPEEIKHLKEQWSLDPIWDIEETEGFEDHKEELSAYRHKCEAEWEAKKLAEEKEIDEAAEAAGVKGIYRMVKQHEKLIARHMRAIEALADGESNLAYRILKSYEEV